MDDLSHLDSSLPDKQPRPIQHGALALLPTELLIQIFNDLLDTGDSGRALALSSCAVRFAVIQVFYRHNGKAIFLLGLQTADVDMLQRCEDFGVASTKYVWEVPLRPSQKTDFESTGYPESIWRAGRKAALYHRPVDRLLESAFAGDHIEQKHYNALKWLVERGHDMSSSNEFWPGRHMVRSLPSQLQKVRDRKSMVLLSRMLQLLSTRGFPTPCTKFALDKLPGIEPEIPSYLISSGDYPGKKTDLNGIRGSLVSLSMRSHCPSSVLRVVLQDYKKRGIQLSDEDLDSLLETEEYDETCRVIEGTIWWHTCKMEDLLGILHGDRFGLWGWEEAYPGEVTDIFTEKLELLVDYEALTKGEEGMLVTVQKAMEDIDDMQKETSLTGPALQKAAWEKLWTPMRPYAREAQEMDFEYEERRLHQFAFARRPEPPYNPWGAWLVQGELEKRRQAWGPMSISDLERALTKDREWQQIWKMFLWDEDYARRPRWYQKGMNEWLNAVERERLDKMVARPEPNTSSYGYWSGFFLRYGEFTLVYL